MIDRIFKSWKSTVAGIVLIALCFGAVYLDKASLTEVSVFILGGFVGLFTKEK